MERTSLDKLIDVLEQIRYDTMPEDVSDKAKLCLMDFVGIFCGSTRKAMSSQLKASLAGELTSQPESLAMWLASSARMLDLDDGHRFAMAHPGVVINATAIAMVVAGGCENANGKAMLEAIVKGYEVYCYQGRIINPGAYLKRGIDATCACGAAGAAATASALMGLNRSQSAGAISLAASVAGGLNQSAIDGSAQKYLVAGFGAKIGIAAARLAAYGLGGPARVFEGKLGFANAFCPDPNREVLENPQLLWDIRDVYLKNHACVRRIHATLDAVGRIMNSNSLTVADIDHVEVGGGQFLCDAGTYYPKDNAQAQTSVPYTVAILLTYGHVEDDLVEENISSEAINALSEKVAVVKDAEIAAMAEKDKSLWGAARVTIFTVDGRKFTEKQIIPQGDREAPFPMEIMKSKFLGHASASIPAQMAQDLWDGLSKLETLEKPVEMLRETLRIL